MLLAICPVNLYNSLHRYYNSIILRNIILTEEYKVEVRESSYRQVKTVSSAQQEQARFLLKVYNWMAGGLLLTGIVAYATANVPVVRSLVFSNSMIFFGLMIAELVMVGALAGWVMKMRAKTAAAVFLGYSFLNGLTLSFIFLVFTRSSITTAFLVSAGTFGAMSLYGAATKKDLSSWGSFFYMGLIGIIIASVVNLFLNNPAVYWATTYLGVLVFVGLTAYDTQKILRMNTLGNEGTEEDTKEAIRGALTLYLDFINLFLMILRILGDRR